VSSRRRASARTLALLLGTLVGLVSGCFSGYDLEDKEPPPGFPGGICLPEGCYGAVECLTSEDVCIDPTDPCKGIYCGGNGTCAIDLQNDNLPFCVCDPGYTNEMYAFFCM
jgi:hypothetical protein